MGDDADKRGGRARVGWVRRVVGWGVTLAAVSVVGAMLGAWVWGVMDIPVFGPVMGLGMFAHLVVTSFVWHLGVVALVLCVVGLFARARVGVVVALVAVVWGLGPWAWSFTNSAPGADGAETLTVYSVNLLYSRADLDLVLAQVEEIGADVVVFQEVVGDAAGRVDVVMSARFPYSYVRLDEFHPSSAKGSATYSRFPIVGESTRLTVLETPDGHAPWPMLRTSIEWGAEVVEVWNVHPAPPTGRSVVALQDAGARSLAATLTGVDGPVVLAGDFNAPPGSVTLGQFGRLGFEEAHDKVGRGLGATWPRLGWKRFVPGVRIDHVMFRGLTCVESGVGADMGSDHAPVWAVFTR